MASEKTIWVLADDRAGNRTQALGVATALDAPFSVKEIAYGAWARLPNAFLGASFLGLAAHARQAMTPPWPGLVIAAGRRTAPVALAIKRKSGGRTRIAQIMNPGGEAARFDLIAVPAHDPLATGENIMTILAAPHGLTDQTLAAARAKWMEGLETLPTPRIALLVGGATRRRQFSESMARSLGEQASRMADEAGGSLMVATSRRTGPVEDVLLGAISCPSRIHRWDDPGENPYSGFLACADAVVVTGDSVSMCSEACASGVGVQIFAPPELITAKHAIFHANLYEAGYAKPFSATFTPGPKPKLDVAKDIAETIKDRLLS